MRVNIHLVESDERNLKMTLINGFHNHCAQATAASYISFNLDICKIIISSHKSSCVTFRSLGCCDWYSQHPSSRDAWYSVACEVLSWIASLTWPVDADTLLTPSYSFVHALSNNYFCFRIFPHFRYSNNPEWYRGVLYKNIYVIGPSHFHGHTRNV